MNPENILTQLKSLVTENRNKADFLELAANLYETGYRTDQEWLNGERQKALDEVAEMVQCLKNEITVLTEEKNTLIGEKEVLTNQVAELFLQVEKLTEENAQLKNPIQ